MIISFIINSLFKTYYNVKKSIIVSLNNKLRKVYIIFVYNQYLLTLLFILSICSIFFMIVAILVKNAIIFKFLLSMVTICGNFFVFAHTHLIMYFWCCIYYKEI